MKNPKEIISKALELIGYDGDKDAFANKLLENILEQAVLDLIETLPQDKQDSLKQELNGIADPQKIHDVVTTYATSEEYSKVLEQTAAKVMEDWLVKVGPSLSETQRVDLETYLASLKPPSQI